MISYARLGVYYIDKFEFLDERLDIYPALADWGELFFIYGLRVKSFCSFCFASEMTSSRGFGFFFKSFFGTGLTISTLLRLGPR